MEITRYNYPIYVKFFMCLLPCSFVIFMSVAMFILLIYLTIVKNMPPPILAYLGGIISIGIVGCVYGLCNCGPIRVDSQYFYHGVSKTEWRKVIGVKEYGAQGEYRIMIIKTSRQNFFFKYIIISSLIHNYIDLSEKIKLYTTQ